MELEPTNRRLFLIGAVAAWLAAAAALPACAGQPGTLGPTLAAWAAFGALLGAASLAGARAWLRSAAIAGEAGAALLLVALHPSYACGDLLVVVGWQAALAWRAAPAAALIAAQTIAAVAVLPAATRGAVTPFLVAVAGFQLFGLVAARIARAEAARHGELAAALSEVAMGEHLLAAADRSAERRRIARELHDVLGHELAALILQLDVASVDPASAAEGVRRARGTAAGLLGRVRAVVADAARPRAGDLAAALAAMVAGVRPLRVELSVDPALNDLDGERALAVMRLVQEGVTNALRHARAHRVEVRVERVGGEIVAAVRDDGGGASAVALGGGLTGMRERLAALGGRLSVTTAAGAGFAIEARLPTAATP